jgi:uncharacterized protein YegL
MSLPGGQMSGRPLHFIWITDCSRSMRGDKIQSLNTAIRESIPEMRKVAQSNPHANVLVRAIKFSSGASWHMPNAAMIERFQWNDLVADGVTDLGRALLLVTSEMKMPPMDPRGLPPVLVLITDGYPTDNVDKGLKALLNEPWGRKAVRIGIGIGADADYDIIKHFINNPEIAPLQANNVEHLVSYIRWASTAVLQSASAPAVTSDASSGQHAGPNIPAPPPSDAGQPAGDVW